MKKIDLINQVIKLGFSKQEAREAVDAIFTTIKEALISNDSVQLVNFGYFKVRERKGRIGTNPQTKEKMVIKDKKTVVFKPSKQLKTLIN